ncbi:hypothetical protein, partial [Pseudomonas aeruginosa]|uniref:hypothetical protein n=1 Tax=Pseudomonas aeruginosa TaxID=287 RepID=UPI002FE3A224
LRVCLRLPAYSASAKVICFIIEKLGDWCPGILPNQEVFFRISLGVLEKAGFIAKKKFGRSNHYMLREKVQVTEAGLPHTVVTWDYVPDRAQQTVTELKKAMIAGDLASTRTLNIERLNIQINLAGGNSQIDLGSLHTDLDRLPAGIRETLRRNLNRRGDLIHSSE